MFVLKFVPTVYDPPPLQVLIGCHNKSANQIAHCSVIVNTRNELQNKVTNIGTLQRRFRTYKRTFEVIFQKRTEIESNYFNTGQIAQIQAYNFECTPCSDAISGPMNRVFDIKSRHDFCTI